MTEAHGQAMSFITAMQSQWNVSGCNTAFMKPGIECILTELRPLHNDLNGRSARVFKAVNQDFVCHVQVEVTPPPGSEEKAAVLYVMNIKNLLHSTFGEACARDIPGIQD